MTSAVSTQSPAADLVNQNGLCTKYENGPTTSSFTWPAFHGHCWSWYGSERVARRYRGAADDDGALSRSALPAVANCAALLEVGGLAGTEPARARAAEVMEVATRATPTMRIGTARNRYGRLAER